MNIALILSGGTGTRMGMGIPKQYIGVKGKPIIAYCLETLLLHESIDAVQIVADQMWRETILQCMASLRVQGAEEKFRGFSEPGKTRQLSILNGLEDIRKYAGDSDYVLVHDAARPLVTERLITDCLAAIQGHEGVLPALPMKDTVYQSEEGNKISFLLDRDRIFAGQAPEAFVLGRYYDANRVMLPERILAVKGSTEPAVLAGMDVVMIAGDEANFKITTQQDLRKFEEIISVQAGGWLKENGIEHEAQI